MQHLKRLNLFAKINTTSFTPTYLFQWKILKPERQTRTYIFFSCGNVDHWLFPIFSGKKSLSSFYYCVAIHYLADILDLLWGLPIIQLYKDNRITYFLLGQTLFKLCIWCCTFKQWSTYHCTYIFRTNKAKQIIAIMITCWFSCAQVCRTVNTSYICMPILICALIYSYKT